MRILLVSHGYPPYGVTGVERVTQHSARSLAALGHEVTVLARRRSAAPPLPRAEPPRLVDGVNVVMVTGGAEPRSHAFPGFHARMEQIFERVLLQALPEVVVIAHMIGHSPGYVDVAHRWHMPVVLELHDFYTACERAHLQRTSGARCDGPDGGRACAAVCFAGEPGAQARWAVRTLAYGRALEHADAVVAPSQFVADYFSDRRGSGGPVHVLPNGVIFEDARRPPVEPGGRPLHIASIGPVTQHKGAHVVLRALRLANLGRARYTLFGEADPQYARSLSAAAAEVPGLDLFITGRYEPELLPSLLEPVDAVVVGSLVWESFSIVAREAMACGVPVIAPRLGALPEAIREGRNGELYEPGSPSSLAAVIKRLDSEPEALAELRAGIERSDWITVAERARRLAAILRRTVDAGTGAVSAREAEEAHTLRMLSG